MADDVPRGRLAFILSSVPAASRVRESKHESRTPVFPARMCIAPADDAVSQGKKGLDAIHKLRDLSLDEAKTDYPEWIQPFLVPSIKLRKRTDIKKIMVVGAGPIVIGQACEFDYSGTQACKALRDEGYSVVLVNSNPATIMTDNDTADRIYIEPLTPEFLELVSRSPQSIQLAPTSTSLSCCAQTSTSPAAHVSSPYPTEVRVHATRVPLHVKSPGDREGETRCSFAYHGRTDSSELVHDPV